MKRYIKSSRNPSLSMDYSPEGRREVVKYYMHDCSVLDACNSVADVAAADFNMMNPKVYAEIIQNNMDKRGLTFEEAKEEFLNTWLDMLERARVDYKRALETAKDYPVLVDAINSYVSDYPLIAEPTPEKDVWVIELDHPQHHQACIDFVDGLRKAVDGRYDGTGYGGSWTTWEMKTPRGLRFRAGWTRDHNWYIEIPPM